MGTILSCVVAGVVVHPSVLVCFYKFITGCINPKNQTQNVEVYYLHGSSLTLLILLASIYLL